MHRLVFDQRAARLPPSDNRLGSARLAEDSVITAATESVLVISTAVGDIIVAGAIAANSVIIVVAEVIIAARSNIDSDACREV